MKRALIIIVIVAVAALVVIWRVTSIQREKQSREEAAARAGADTSIVVRVAPVITGDIEEVLKYTGRVEADDEIDITPKIAGRIVKVHVQEGDDVAKDQTVMTIDPEVTGMKFELHSVTSPITGKVAYIYMDRGAYVTQGVPLMEVVNDASVKVVLGILEKDYPDVKEGTAARIEFDALPGETYKGRLSNIRPVVDAAAGTAGAEIRMQNSEGRLKSGMFARVQLVAETHENATLMPRAATLTELFSERESEVETAVFVADQGVARKRTVHLGISNVDYFEVLDGLTPGEQVIVEGQNMVRDGSPIEIQGSGEGF
jgi:membrane fusion protein (multidrug efflux system)